LESIDASQSGVSIRFLGVGGLSYTVLYTDNLPAGDWAKLDDRQPEISSEQEVVDDSGLIQGRFYRLVTPMVP